MADINTSTSSGSANCARNPSPRSVDCAVDQQMDEKQIVPTTTPASIASNGSESDGNDSEEESGIVPASADLVDAHAAKSNSNCSNPQAIFGGIVLNRETITIAGLAITVGIFTTCAGTICFAILAGILTSPLWIPVAFLTSPFWIPAAFLTSPLWVSAVAIGVICLLWAAFFAFVIFASFLFFAWPKKWLPQDSDKSKWFLRKRDDATIALVKLQAKLVLYAAGVGPLADAALAILDRVDLVEVQKALSEFDLAQFADDVKKMDIGEIQAAVVSAIRSFVGL